MNLEDWFTEVPPIEEMGSDIGGILSEFGHLNVLKGHPNEPPPEKKGDAFSHQDLFKRIFTRTMNDCLVFHRAGTGKSITVLLVTEFYRKLAKQSVDRAHIPSIIRPVGYKKVFILTGGPTVEENLKFELTCKLSTDIIDDRIRSLKTVSGQKSAISQKLNKFYSFMTYYTFTNSIQDLSDEDLIETFNQCIFVIDEAHSVLYDIDAQNRLKNLPMIYHTLVRLFRLLPRRKIFLVTATPMHNSPAEILQLMSLLITQEEQDELYADVNRVGLYNSTVLERIFNKYVSFVDKSETGAKPMSVGIELFKVLNQNDVNQVSEAADEIRQSSSIGPDYETQGFIRQTPVQSVTSQLSSLGISEQGDLFIEAPQVNLGTIGEQPNVYTTILTPIFMKPYQQQIYTQVSGGQYEPGIREAFSTRKRQCINFAFPDGSIGKAGFDRFTVHIPVEGDKNHYIFSQEMQTVLSQIKQTREDIFSDFSVKFQFLCDIIRTYASQGKKGYVYNEYKETGAILEGLCLTMYGYERFHSKVSVFRDIGIQNPDFCGQGTSRMIMIPKRWRYALFTPEEDPTGLRYTMELFNSPENRHGEYIQVILFSPVGRESVSLDSCQFIVVDGSWTLASYEQAVNRGLRATSHDALMEENSGQPVEVDIYRIAVLPVHGRTETGLPTYNHFQEPRSVDIDLLKLSEEKGRDIKIMERKMKINAFDCYLEYPRNVPGTKIDYSMECEFMKCAYDCAGRPPDQDKDYLGILLSEYSQDYHGLIKTSLARYFKTSDSYIPISEFITQLNTGLLNPLPEDLILVVLHELSSKHVPFQNKFGFYRYITVDKGYIILGGTFSELQYVNNIVALEINSTKEIDKQIQSEVGETSIQMLGLPFEQFRNTFFSMTIGQKIPLVESIIIQNQELIRQVLDDEEVIWPSDTLQFVINYYLPKIFIVDDPTFAVNEAVSRSTSRSPRVMLQPTGQKIFAHSIKALEDLPNFYTIATDTIRPKAIRVLRPESQRWQDISLAEMDVYKTLIETQIVERETEYLLNGLQEFNDPLAAKGGYDVPFIMTIIDDPERSGFPEQNVFFVGGHERDLYSQNKRSQERGHRLKNANTTKLISMLYKVGYVPRGFNAQQLFPYGDYTTGLDHYTQVLQSTPSFPKDKGTLIKTLHDFMVSRKRYIRR